MLLKVHLLTPSLSPLFFFFLLLPMIHPRKWFSQGKRGRRRQKKRERRAHSAKCISTKMTVSLYSHIFFSVREIKVNVFKRERIRFTINRKTSLSFFFSRGHLRFLPPKPPKGLLLKKRRKGEKYSSSILLSCSSF